MSSSTVMDRTEAANPPSFDTTFSIALGAPYSKATVRPWHTTTGAPIVDLDFGDEGGIKSLTPAEALSLAAALQAVAVYGLEEPRVLRRTTEPGQPDLDDMQLGAGDDRIGGER